MANSFALKWQRRRLDAIPFRWVSLEIERGEFFNNIRRKQTNALLRGIVHIGIRAPHPPLFLSGGLDGIENKIDALDERRD